MKKSGILIWIVFLLLGMSACDNIVVKSNVTKEDDLPPGTEYVADGEHCLNVVYYVPANLDTLSRWHKRLSGITLYMKEFFRQGMADAGYKNPLFLMLNKNNPAYIKITYLKGKYETTGTLGRKQIMEEVFAHFKAKPSEQLSNQFLVYVPKFRTTKDSIVGFTARIPDESEAPAAPSEIKPWNCGFVIAECDHERFEIRHVNSPRARKKYLSKMPSIAHELGHSFGLYHNGNLSASLYFSIMRNVAADSTNIRRFRPNPADALCMNELSVFGGDDGDRSVQPEITITDVKLDHFANDTIHVECAFTSPSEITGAIIYVDPWSSTAGAKADTDSTTYSDDDQITIVVKKIDRTGDQYHFVMEFPFSQLSGLYRITSMKLSYEFRFRFVAKGGLTFPYRSVKGGSINGMFRWPFGMTRTTIVGSRPTQYIYATDIAARYRK